MEPWTVALSFVFFGVLPHSLKNSMCGGAILAEFLEMQSNPSNDFKCLHLPGNLFNWQFAIRGPNGTDFEGGIYHGRIQFPEGYPRRFPKFKILTENGCFKTHYDISNLLFRRRESTVRDALRRLIDLLPSYPDGELASAGYDKETRRRLANESRNAPPNYGSAERRKLINEIHKCMLDPTHLLPSIRGRDIRIEQNATTAATDIEKELEEMQSNPSEDFKCFALAGNVHDWQVAFRGPSGTEFEGGIYHAHIQFPEEYPLNCPTFMLLTENGRFETQTEIWFDCHTSKVRDTLLTLIEMLPAYSDGALGSVKYDKEEKLALAIKSREAPPKYGTDERQNLIDEIHKYMLSKVTPLPLPSNRGGDMGVSSQNDRGKRNWGKSIQLSIGNTINANIFTGNTINANNAKHVGVFDFEKMNACNFSFWIFAILLVICVISILTNVVLHFVFQMHNKNENVGVRKWGIEILFEMSIYSLKEYCRDQHPSPTNQLLD